MLWGHLVLLALVGIGLAGPLGLPVVANANCSSIAHCPNITAGCGGCWDSLQSKGQQHGARPGSELGPSDGMPCSDWEYDPSQCLHHVDCRALPNCLNILGTYCGWCGENNKPGNGMRGNNNNTGPFHPGQCQDTWVSDYKMCPLIVGPQQIHMNLGESPSELVITWASYHEGTATAVARNPNLPPRVFVANSTYWRNETHNSAGAPYVHRVLFTDLPPKTTFTFTVSVGNHTTEPFSYTTVDYERSDWPARFLVFGDMGRYGGGQVLDKLNEEVETESYAAAIHIGDAAYDLVDKGALNGDAFMERIQPIATKIPYMFIAGNHEIESNTFANYRNRFSMPNYDTQYWYSWDIQKVHFIAYSTEVYFANTEDIERQYRWLEQDLIKANSAKNRAERPWIIAYGHRPMYCSMHETNRDCRKFSSLVRLGLEDLFHQYGVDIVMAGHEHAYERMWPLYNYTVPQENYIDPSAMVHFITGAAGCNEHDGSCLNLIYEARGPFVAFYSTIQGTYSYGHLTIFNDTHAYFNSYVVEEERIEDEVWIVQHHHGMRTPL